MSIYLYKNDEQFGPYSLEQVQAFIDTKSFRPTDSAWFEGCEDWTTISQVPGITFSAESLRQHLVPPFEAYTGEAPYVFISYAHADGEVVFREIRKLHEAGYRIWYDEGIEPGDDWPQHIAQAVVNCSLFLIFTSPRSAASENCRNEINLALNRKKKFLSIYLEETELPLGLELRMGDLQAILKYRMPELTYRKKMFSSLENLLGKEGRDVPEGQDPVAAVLAQKAQADRLAAPIKRKTSAVPRVAAKPPKGRNLQARQSTRPGQSNRPRQSEKKPRSTAVWIGATLAILALLGSIAFWPSSSNETQEVGESEHTEGAEPTAKERHSSAKQTLNPIFRERVKRKKGNPVRQRAITRGLTWLKNKQAPSGGWISPADAQAMTALALMSLLCESPSLDSQEHGKSMKNALAFLTSIPGRATNLNQPKSYSHAIRAQGLCEAYLISQDPALEKFVVPAVQSILDGQNENGGWAYGYGKGKKAHTDLSVTSWNMQAVKLASLTNLPFAGIEQCLQKATDYVFKCHSAKGTFAYKIGTGGKASLTGAGVYCLSLTGNNYQKQAFKAMDWLISNQPTKWSEINAYAHYYNTHALAYAGVFAEGEKYWASRGKVSPPTILKSQLGDGSWPKGAHFHGDSDIFRTLLILLSLQADYRYASL